MCWVQREPRTAKKNNDEILKSKNWKIVQCIVIHYFFLLYLNFLWLEPQIPLIRPTITLFLCYILFIFDSYIYWAFHMLPQITCFMFTEADAVQICNKFWDNLYICVHEYVHNTSFSLPFARLNGRTCPRKVFFCVCTFREYLCRAVLTFIPFYMLKVCNPGARLHRQGIRHLCLARPICAWEQSNCLRKAK